MLRRTLLPCCVFVHLLLVRPRRHDDAGDVPG